MFAPSVQMGCLMLNPQNQIHIQQKIGYGFVLPSYAFEIANRASESDDAPLNCNSQNIRAFYHMLLPEQKTDLVRMLNIVFPEAGLKDIRSQDKKHTFTVTNDGVELEIMFAGSALQKVFASLVVLLWLVQQRGNFSSCYFLMEEPEAMLSPSAVPGAL
eukprot:c22164_g1_i1.p1 GENE.c22164_g1_i1~~c22164_g1_i1.p1  ORF type:complete len:159 (+),score=35.96 c22164_g1_i1:345-821(+)